MENSKEKVSGYTPGYKGTKPVSQEAIRRENDQAVAIVTVFGLLAVGGAVLGSVLGAKKRKEKKKSVKPK